MEILADPSVSYQLILMRMPDGHTSDAMLYPTNKLTEAQERGLRKGLYPYIYLKSWSVDKLEKIIVDEEVDRDTLFALEDCISIGDKKYNCENLKIDKMWVI